MLEQTSSSVPSKASSMKTTELEFHDIKVKVLTDRTPASLKRVKEVVETKKATLDGKAGEGLSSSQRCLLVAYGLAEELLQLREEFRVFKEEALERSERLLSRVESHLDRQ